MPSHMGILGIVLTVHQGATHTLIMTLVFPDSLSKKYPRTAPLAHEVVISANGSVHAIPSTGNPLSPISQDTALAFSVPYDEASDFLSRIQELPNGADAGTSEVENGHLNDVSNGWVMKAAKKNGTPARTTIRDSANNAWTGFVDLIKVCHVLVFRHPRECR